MISDLAAIIPSAYIEPSAMSYVVQAIAGTLVILGAAVSLTVVYFRKKAAALLNRQENNDLEVEEDIVIVPGEGEK